ncbi:MAG: hypothetical protein M3450_05435 [Actinomycetota bacterium]|nr:hypothetical protein [Actinomycetota bacterium]
MSDFTNAVGSDRGRPLDHMPKLSRAELTRHQETTLDTPRRRYGPAARILFAALDLVYGRARTLSKFKVLEVVARVPYQAWEQVAFVAVTHRYSRPKFARRIFERAEESRHQQDNEMWHLLILEELVEEEGRRESFLRHRVFPQVLAFGYYHVSWLLYVVHPAWSYGMNADFEDHAQHEYVLFVQENPDFELRRYDGMFAEEYGRFDSVGDLFRQISHDELVHKEESLGRLSEPRFR